jgi:glutamate racemase
MQNTQKNDPVWPFFEQEAAMGRESLPIAVMDSGAGGLSVLRQIRRMLPREELLYFGDSANAPYGERSKEELIPLILSHAERLLTQAKALVVACNTATALAIDELRRRHHAVPIVGIEPALKPACALGDRPRVWVLVTEVTLREERFVELLQKYEKVAHVVPICAQGIVKLVEMGAEDSPEMRGYLQELFAPYLPLGVDAIVLGCTHFPHLKTLITRVADGRAEVVDSSEAVARQAERRLRQENGLNPSTQPGRMEFLVPRS